MASETQLDRIERKVDMLVRDFGDLSVQVARNKDRIGVVSNEFEKFRQAVAKARESTQNRVWAMITSGFGRAVGGVVGGLLVLLFN